MWNKLGFKSRIADKSRRKRPSASETKESPTFQETNNPREGCDQASKRLRVESVEGITRLGGGEYDGLEPSKARCTKKLSEGME